MRLQRLAYPFTEKVIPQDVFGNSRAKYNSIRLFFGCAANGAPEMRNGEIQDVIDKVYAQRHDAVGHRMTFNRPPHLNDKNTPATTDLFLYGLKSSLPAFEQSVRNLMRDFVEASSQPNGVAINPPAEAHLIQFMVNPVSSELHTDETTMGWLDLDTGCFATKSMTSLNRVRELLGVRPHMAMRRQNDNYHPEPNA